MARSTAGITKDGATPKPSPSAPEENPPELAGYAEPTREEEDEPLPVVNVEETLGGPWGRNGNDRSDRFRVVFWIGTWHDDLETTTELMIKIYQDPGIVLQGYYELILFLPWLQEEVPEKETELKVDIQEGPPPSSGWRLGSWWMVDNRSNIFFAPDEGIYIYTHMRVFVLGPCDMWPGEPCGQAKRDGTHDDSLDQQQRHHE